MACVGRMKISSHYRQTSYYSSSRKIRRDLSHRFLPLNLFNGYESSNFASFSRYYENQLYLKSCIFLFELLRTLDVNVIFVEKSTKSLSKEKNTTITCYYVSYLANASVHSQNWASNADCW